MAEADRVIGDIADPSRTNTAENELEIARNMMDQQDGQGCMVAYIDNAIRAIK